jgi:hypothetical protein
MSPPLKREHVEAGDLLVINHTMIGRLAYRVEQEFMQVILVNIDNGYQYDREFSSLEELDTYVSTNNMFTHVPLN